MNSTNSSIDLIILAAGASKRLGRPKQLLTYHGKSLLQQVVDLSQQVRFGSRILVLGANAELIGSKVQAQNMKVVVNSKWKEGLSSSVKCGLEELLEINPESNDVMFLLCDQPFLTLEVLNELISTHRSSAEMITVSKYEGQLGVPMIFSKPFYKELMTLKGDAGAKKIVVKHLESVQEVPFENGKFDIDTSADYQKLIE